MYKKLLPALCLFSSAGAFAQAPTLTAVNVGPVIHDTLVSLICDTTGITPGASGASVTWNFATLTPSTVILSNKDTGAVVAAPSATGYASLQAEAALLGSAAAFNASTYATATPSNTATTFYEVTPTRLSQTGVYVNAGNNGVYTDPVDQLHFPFTYGNTYSDTYAGGIVYTSGMTSVTATESGTATAAADGWGTLILPGTPTVTYSNVLRVHSTQTFHDSANLFGPVVLDYTLQSYNWYMPGYHAPLLSISTVTGSGVNNKNVSYAYKQLANHAAVPGVPGIEATLSVYPNPATDYVYITYTNTANDKVRTSITDMAGREVANATELSSAGITHVTFRTAALPKGNYIVRLQSAAGTATRKIQVQ